MQAGCQQSSAPHISTEAGEEHTVPGEEENRQRDRKMEGEEEEVGPSEEGTTGKGVRQHDPAAGLTATVKGRFSK